MLLSFFIMIVNLAYYDFNKQLKLFIPHVSWSPVFNNFDIDIIDNEAIIMVFR